MTFKNNGYKNQDKLFLHYNLLESLYFKVYE